MTVQTERDPIAAPPSGGGQERPDRDQFPSVLRVAEEKASVHVERSLGEGVRVSVVTDETPTNVAVDLESQAVDVTRHPVGREIDEFPQPREEGDILIIPVVEERAVIVRKLFLVEEVHVRRSRKTDRTQVPVMLRRQRATIDQLEAPETDPGENP